MLQPFTTALLALTTLMEMTPVTGTTGPERYITLTPETASAAHEVHVAAGTATVLLFDSPVLPASLELAAARERFERIDVTERALILLPRGGLAAHERIPLTLRFADGQRPGRVTFVLTSKPATVDHQVRVFRGTLAPKLRTTQARCEDSGRLSNLLRWNGVAVERLSPRLVSEDSPPHLHVVDLRAFIAPGFIALEVALLLGEGQPAWSPGLVEVLDEETLRPVPVRAVDLDAPALQPRVPGRLVLELRADSASTAERVRIRILEQGGTRGVSLGDVRLPGRGVAH